MVIKDKINCWKNYESFEDSSNSNFLSSQQKQDEQEDEAVPKHTSADSITMFLNAWNIRCLKNASLSANQCAFTLQQFLSFLKHLHCCKKRKNEVDPDKFEIMTFLPKMDVNDDE